VIAPATVDEAAAALDAASEAGEPVRIEGGGTHSGYGYPVAAETVVSTRALDRIVEWRPEDLTVVVEAGVRIAELEATLAEKSQTAVLSEQPGDGTVGGIVAAGLSGWRRLRFGPTRDRVLEVVLATGDGRVVRAGGQVVKNVTGYDVARLACGSLGSLGLIARVAFKLWPLREATATVRTDSDAAAFRPLADLVVDGERRVYLAGTREEVDAQAGQLGGDAVPGLDWPDEPAGDVGLVARVPARLTRDAAARAPAGWSAVAALGVGEVRIAGEDPDPEELAALRKWTEAEGGALVVARGDLDLDPWGTPPKSLELQRRVKAAFDPLGVCNPGVLPGGL
jgi:glycolate oxidase FAD binding subunit